MNVLKQECKEGILSVTLRIEPIEFQKALTDAYLEHTETYPVPGFAAGLAPRNAIEKLYGPTALFDEALDLCVPDMYRQFLQTSPVSIIGQPQLTEVTWLEGGGASFTVVCDQYPEVTLGQYRGITVPLKREENEEAFAAAVLTKACSEMKTEVPVRMIEQKLNAMTAQEKMRIGQDPIYHVLADTLAILEKAYKETGVNRPISQIRAEALDTMLQTVSKDNKTVTKEFFLKKIKELIERYRFLPFNIDQVLEEILEEQNQKKRSMTPDEKTDAAFLAYLASLDLNKSQWRKERWEQAADAARFDLLFKAIAEIENLTITTSELQDAYRLIADQCTLEIDEVIAQIDPEPIKAQILRDKARQLVLDNANTEFF